jgi:hypothetical protein
MKEFFWVTPVKEVIGVDSQVIKTTLSKNKTVETIKRTSEVYIEFSCGHSIRKTDFPKGLSATRFDCFFCRFENKQKLLKD